MITHTICSGIELYCYYELSDEFSKVIVDDHVKAKCCKKVWVMII